MSHTTNATDAEKAAGATNGGGYEGYTGGPALQHTLTMESQVSPVPDAVRVRRMMLTRCLFVSVRSRFITVNSATLRLLGCSPLRRRP